MEPPQQTPRPQKYRSFFEALSSLSSTKKDGDGDSQQHARLLRLPLRDFPPSVLAKARGRSGVASSLKRPRRSKDEEYYGDERLMLLQLPLPNKDGVSLLSVEDLVSREGVRVVGDDESTTLVAEGGVGRSFEMRRCETSNALVLVPPPSVRGNVADARLLAKPSAHFLELRERPLDRRALLESLEARPYDPWHCRRDDENGNEDESPGASLDELREKLRCSRRQVLRALESLSAMRLPGDRFVFLGEEVAREATDAVVAAIVEADDEDRKSWLLVEKDKDEPCVVRVRPRGCRDAAVNNLTSRREREHQFSGRIVRHCLRTLCEEGLDHERDDDDDDDDDELRLLLIKVAAHLAHRLFRSRHADDDAEASSWPVVEFLERWHALMPSAGNYVPTRGDLAGVALETTAVDSDDEDVRLRYFPRDLLPLDPAERFRALFREQGSWTRQDLEPYLQDLGSSEEERTELLLRHARATTSDENVTTYRSA